MSAGLTLEKLQVIITAQTAPLQKELDKVKKQVESATSSVNRNVDKINKKTGILGSQLGKAFSFVAITYGLAKFASAAVNLSSQLEEVQNVVDVSFGDMSYKIEAFSKTALKSFGLSELTAKKTASSFMAMSVGMGIGREKASNMSLEMTGLSADMASFYNISNDMAQTALSSVWTGETETLKKYGILITEVNLQQFAYKQGIEKNINTMTQAEKTTLRYLYVQDALSLAQGDFVRTSGSWANQVRILTETFKELSTIIGNGIIKALTPVIQIINVVLNKLVQFAKAVQVVFGRLFGTKGAGSSASTDKASSSLGGYNNTLKDTEKQAKKTANSLSFLDELNVIKSPEATGGSSSSNPSVGGDGFDIDFGDMSFEEPDSGPIEAFADKLMKYFEPLKNISFDNIVESFGKVWEGLQRVGQPIFDWLEFLYLNMFVPLAEWTIEDALPAFLDVVAAALEVVGSVLEIILPLAKDFWTSFLEPIASFVGDVFVGFLEILADLLNDISDWIRENKTLVETIVIVIGSFAAAWHIVMGALNLVHTAVVAYNAIVAIGATVTAALTAAITFLTSPIGLVVIAIGAVIAIVILLIKHWDDVAAFGKKCWDNIVNTFKGAATWFDDTFIKPIENDFKSFCNNMIGGVEGFVNGGIRGINGLIKALNNLIKFDFPDWLPIIGGESFSLNLGMVKEVSLPRMYNGGLVHGDTLARVGDYAGSSVNPEVIAPLSTLKEYISGGLDQEGIVLFKEAIAILKIIANKNLSIDGSTIGKVAKEFIDNENERTGGYVFG